MCMRKQVMNIFLPTYNAVCDVLQSSWVHVCRRSCLPAPVQVVCTSLYRHRPAADSRGLRLCLPQCPRTSIRNGYPSWLGNWVLKATIIPCSTAEIHIRQAGSFINIGLQISVYCKWALGLKILILCSQKFHGTKFLSSRKWRNRPLFWPCAGEHVLFAFF